MWLREKVKWVNYYEAVIHAEFLRLLVRIPLTLIWTLKRRRKGKRILENDCNHRSVVSPAPTIL